MTTTIQTPQTLIDGPFGARLLLEAGAFSLVEHPIAPHTLAGPSHVHQHEDEYSYVLEGEAGFEVGEDVFTVPARVLEVISPAGFEQYFGELAQLIPPIRPERDLEGLAELQARYGLEMDFGSIERLSREHGLGSP